MGKFTDARQQSGDPWWNSPVYALVSRGAKDGELADGDIFAIATLPL